MPVDDNDPRPPYVQIADELRLAIGAGRYPTGTRLPALNEMAKTYGAARMTVRRALEILSRQGYIVAQQGRGTFVREVLPEPSTATPNAGLFDTLSQRLDDACEAIEALARTAEQMEDLKRRVDRLESQLRRTSPPAGEVDQR